jgi:DNA-binding NarL/FixJ family response regulator
MIRVVIMAAAAHLADLAAKAMPGERDIEVMAMVGDPARFEEPAVREALAASEVLVYVADRPIGAPPWGEPGPGGGPAVVIANVSGHVGMARALQLGARGYVGPHETGPALAQRIREAATGKLAVPPGAVASIRAAMGRLGQEEIEARGLRKVEVWLMQRIALGESVQQIARRLSGTGGRGRITKEAAYSRIRRLREKLGDLPNEAAVAARAGEWGLLYGDLPEEPPPDRA